jgi:GGDEF domain-containing protein
MSSSLILSLDVRFERSPEPPFRVAVRLRSVIGTADVPPFGKPLMASIGIAEWMSGTSGKQLVARAESAMLAAKAQNAGIISASEAATTAVMPRFAC